MWCSAWHGEELDLTQEIVSCVGFLSQVLGTVRTKFHLSGLKYSEMFPLSSCLRKQKYLPSAVPKSLKPFMTSFSCFLQTVLELCILKTCSYQWQGKVATRPWSSWKCGASKAEMPDDSLLIFSLIFFPWRTNFNHYLILLKLRRWQEK